MQNRETLKNEDKPLVELPSPPFIFDSPNLFQFGGIIIAKNGSTLVINELEYPMRNKMEVDLLFSEIRTKLLSLRLNDNIVLLKRRNLLVSPIVSVAFIKNQLIFDNGVKINISAEDGMMYIDSLYNYLSAKKVREYIPIFKLAKFLTPPQQLVEEMGVTKEEMYRTGRVLKLKDKK